MMHIETIRELRTARSFRPCTMHMADGRSVEVRHPEFMAISPNGRTAVAFSPEGKKGAGHGVDIMLVTDIELNPDRSNGEDRKKAS